MASDRALVVIAGYSCDETPLVKAAVALVKKRLGANYSIRENARSIGINHATLIKILANEKTPLSRATLRKLYEWTRKRKRAPRNKRQILQPVGRWYSDVL